MAKYEIEAEYDDPKEIPFKKNCVYCFEPAPFNIHVEEQSKIRNLWEKSFFPILFLFIIYCFILYPFLTDRSLTAPALFLAILTWSFLSLVLKRRLKNLFRYADAYACSSCFAKCKKREKVHSIYWVVIFSCFLILVVLSVLYRSDELKSSDFAVTVFALLILGILLQSWIIGLVERFFGLKLKLPFLLTKQGLIRGSSKIAMSEEVFTKLVDEKVEDDKTQN
jgi:hypothetical protein